MAAISAMPCPAVTRVPENTEGRSSPPGLSSARASADGNFRTGTDSPVSSDSSVERLMPRRRRPSAGTRSPSERTTRSPLHHLAPRDAPMHAVANDERPRARQIAQRLQRPLRAPLLDDGDGHDHEHEAEQHQGVGRLAHEEVEGSRGDEHEEHGLACDLEARWPAELRFFCAGSSFGPSCCRRVRASSSLSPRSPPRSRTAAGRGASLERESRSCSAVGSCSRCPPEMARPNCDG